jgi:hypothetical protein
VVPPCSDRISRVPPYSSPQIHNTCTGLSPAKARLSRRFQLGHLRHWPGPRSLATTSGVSVDVLSSGYLDVSVPRVCSLAGTPCGVGCPIRKFTDQSLFAAPHDLSQRITSFIASCRQGIHRMPLRHLITLIINAHLFSRQRRKKDDPFVRYRSIPVCVSSPLRAAGIAGNYLSTNDHHGLPATSRTTSTFYTRPKQAPHKPIIDNQDQFHEISLTARRSSQPSA